MTSAQILFTALVGAVIYLSTGMRLARWFIGNAGSGEMEDWSDYLMFGMVTLIGPVVAPFLVVIYWLGRVGASLMEMPTKGEDD